MSVSFNQKNTNHLTSLAFLDPNGGVSIQRYDTMKYKAFDKLTEKQLGFFWQPQEVALEKDSGDFKKLTTHEKHIFTSNLKRQILLDSVQGRCPSLAFLPVVSLPEVEAWIQNWSFSETIHSRSYSHIIRNVYSSPSEVFDTMMDIQEIVDCASDISENYDNLISLSQYYNLLGAGTHIINGKEIVVDLYDLKKKLWLCLMSVNILEGLRFYVSFACSWAFAEVKKMEGNAAIIKLICRDENLHLASTQLLLKLLVKDDPDYEKISQETMAECIEMFVSAANQEKAWAHYLFKDGSMIGLNEQLLNEYVDWIGAKRMQAVNLKCPWKVPNSNPLPWTNKWIAGSDVQVLPQEVTVTQYTSGDVNQDVTQNTFSGFSL